LKQASAKTNNIMY